MRLTRQETEYINRRERDLYPSVEKQPEKNMERITEHVNEFTGENLKNLVSSLNFTNQLYLQFKKKGNVNESGVHKTVAEIRENRDDSCI